METKKTILKYFWKFLGVTFLIELLWFIICFSIGYFFLPNVMRHLAGLGFIIIPFLTAYNTMWVKIDELETFIEAKFYEEQNKDLAKKNPSLDKKKKQLRKKPKLEKIIIIDADTPTKKEESDDVEEIKKEVQQVEDEEEF